MPASVKDVAALAGVSSSTVSNYLNHPHLLVDATRERVRAAVEELGYVPNESARQLRAGSGKVIAVVLLDAWLPYFHELSRGVEDAIRPDGWSLFFSNSSRDATQELRNIDMFEAHRMRGLIIYPRGDVLPRLETLADRGIRSVVIGPIADSAKVSAVVFDDVGGGRLAGEHLVAIGRKRIAFIGDPQAVSQSQDRWEGLRSAAGTHAAIEVIPTAGLAVEDGFAAADSLLRRAPSDRPDAIFAANDLVAVGTLTALARAGVRVPQDIAIIGFDDVPQARECVIPLTTVRQPGYEIGKAAGELLLRLLGEGEQASPTALRFAAELVVRGSTIE